MKYTVGIVTYERPESIAETLDSLTRQTRPPEEVIVVDDSPGEDTAESVEEFRDAFDGIGTDLTYLHRVDSRSMPGGRNEIIDRAVGNVICFIDDDVVCTDTWLASISECYDQRDPAGVCGPAIRTDGDLEPTDERTTEQSNQNTVNGYGDVTEISHKWVPPEPVETEVARGANMSFKTEFLECLGGFDVDYQGPAIFEEWDLMTRLRQAGGKLVYHPGALLYHFEAPEGGARSDDGVSLPPSYWYAKNSLLFRKNNFPDAYRRSLARIAFRGTDQLPPVWRRIASIVAFDTSQYYWLKGYWDGVSQ